MINIKLWFEFNFFIFIFNDRGGILGGVCFIVIVVDYFGGGGFR